MIHKIKIICCMPFMLVGAAIGIVSQCIVDGYEWGKDDFFS